MWSRYLGRFRKFRSFLGSQVWRLFFLSVVLGVALFLVEFSFVFVFQGFLSALGLVEASKLTVPSWYPRSFSGAILFLFAFGAARAIAYMFRFYVNGVTGQAFIRLQRARIIEFGLQNMERVASHEVINVVTDKVNQASYVLQNISQMIQIGTSCLLFFASGVRLAPFEMLISMAFLGAFMFPLRIVNRNISEYGDGVRGAWDHLSRTLIQGLRNNFFLKLYGLVPREVEHARSLLRSYEDNFRSYYFVVSVKNYIPNILGIIVICSVSWISMKHLHTPGTVLISFFYLFVRLAQGASDASVSAGDFRLYYPSFIEVYQWHERLVEFEEDGSRTPAKEESKPLNLSGGIRIQLKNAGFSFPDQSRLFSGLDFQVAPGDLLLIKGPSGSGKSTLLMNLLGLVSPTEGEVLINGMPSHEVRSSLSELIGYIGPEPYMIQGTLRENLLFGHLRPESVGDERMREALRIAELPELAVKLDQRFAEQTPLSTGQKQRIAIARALVRKPSVLILDEATANLDVSTEAKIIHSLSDYFSKCITVVISHRDSFDLIATQMVRLGGMEKRA